MTEKSNKSNTKITSEKHHKLSESVERRKKMCDNSNEVYVTDMTLNGKLTATDVPPAKYSGTEENSIANSFHNSQKALLLQRNQKYENMSTSINTKIHVTNGQSFNQNLPNSAPINFCTNPSNCITLKNILDSFKSPLSEEQAWALLYQLIHLYRQGTTSDQKHVISDLEMPDTTENINLHRDGAVHCSWSEAERREKEQKVLKNEQQLLKNTNKLRGDDNHTLLLASHKKLLRKVAVIVYTALDYNLPEDEQCQMSPELEELITYMTAEDYQDECIDEGIDEGYKRWDDDSDYDYKYIETKEFDFVLEACKKRIKPTVPENHYKAVCRALVTESIELRIFLQQVLNDDGGSLHLVTDCQTSKQELAQLGFNDWARFWVQVIEELRRGVRLKKNNYSRTPIEFELTPYEILMEDIRSKKYQLRKVMVNGDIPPRVKKDAHALILDFIRSRPPLKKASERKLAPPMKRVPSPREQLMDSIRKGQTLKHIQPPSPLRLKDRLLTSTTTLITTSKAAPATKLINSSASTKASPEVITARVGTSAVSCVMLDANKISENMDTHPTPRSNQRLIKVDFSLLQDDAVFFDEPHVNYEHCNSSTATAVYSQPQMPPYPIGEYMTPSGASFNNNGSGVSAGVGTAVDAGGITQKLHTAHNSRINLISAKPIPGVLTTNTRATDALRRTTYNTATQSESRRASLRRHTLVGCQCNNLGETDLSEMLSAGEVTKGTTKQQQEQSQIRFQSPSVGQTGLEARFESINSGIDGANDEINSSCSCSSSSFGPWNKSFLDEKTWLERGDDRLSLTLEEIVHIRSVMTKAELEGLPVGVHVKEDVEKRKVCFLCLRTRFSIFGPWGIQCKLCQRTVCSKCHTKMRIPTEHFRNVPLVLISPSLLASPTGSNTPSPLHHSHHTHSSSTGNILDETFPKSLIERLLRSESERKTRYTVGSAPSSPKQQRSNMSTPSSNIGAPGRVVHSTSQTVDTADISAVMSSHATTSNMGFSNGISCCTQPMPAQIQHANNKHINIMSRSMEGPHSLPTSSPARAYSNSSTLEKKNKFSRAFTLSSSGTHLSQDQKENMRGEVVTVCNDCKGLVMEITRSSKQTRSSARNRTLQNLTLDLSPVYK